MDAVPHDIDPDLLRTRTDHGEPLDSGVEPEGLVLVILYHPDPRYEGVRLGLSPGEQLELGRGGATLGAGALDDSLLSRRHVRLSASADSVHLTDLDSHNGTWVDGRRVGSGIVSPGAIIGIGSLLLGLIRGSQDVGAGAPLDMVGHSPALARIQEQIALVGPQQVPVLIQGETGTGKEHVAAALHEASDRLGPLVQLNCGAVADSLLHSELFGHVSGAFSGARGARGGLVGRAEGGTLFLDEIGEASASLQTSLLRLLENGEYRAVGSDENRKADVRFIAATHVDLRAGLEDGRFRADLFGRLQRWVIEVPPLRKRPEDVMPIARHFIAQLAGEDVKIERGLALRLLRHPWPLNVRELRAVIERAVVEADGGALALTPTLSRQLTSPEPAATPAPTPPRQAKPDADGLRAALLDHGGNVRALARSLGIGRTTAYRWLNDAGIDPDEVR